MSYIFNAPSNIQVTPKDGAVHTSWDETEGADGYKLFYYSADAPDNCIKTRYSQGTSKTIYGFHNGSEYLVSVCAFRQENNREILGEMSEKLSFTPISETLKAQKVLCLEPGKTAQIEWECRNSVPKALFVSDNEDIAIVDPKGRVTAVADGVTYISVMAEKQVFRTKVAVNRIIRRGEKKAVLMFTGDLMCTAKHQREAEKIRFDFHESFSNIKPILAEADLAVGVLETTCHDGSPYESEMLRLPKGSPNCNSPSSFLTAIADAGFGALVTANNHNCDTGRAGLESTVKEIKRLGMENIGTMGSNPVIREINGIRVGFIACCMISNGLEQIHFPCMDMVIGRYKRDYFIELVNGAMSMGAEYIVAYQHWGSMNSTLVRKNQAEEAKFMASCGVDLIIGSHPHVIQKMDIITTEDGRRVPCAYSLGNFLTTMSEMKENRDSVILRAELSRNDEGKVTAALSFIPCYCETRYYGASVELAYPPYSKDSKASYERTKSMLGTNLNHYTSQPKILLSGSPILSRIFACGNRFKTDKTGILVSQLAACGTPDYEIPETHNRSLLTELQKTLPEHMLESKPDYIAVDLYTAAGVSCYKLGKHLFTGTKLFKKSRFYRDRKDEFERLRPPFDEELWQQRIAEYAKAVLAAVPHDRVVLFRQCFSDRRADYNSLRTAESRKALNQRIREMEDYFIRLVRPAIVDLSKTYITSGKKLSAYENDYFTDAYRAFVKIASPSGRRCIHQPDVGLWFNRVMKYYDSMTAKGLQGWLLDMDNAADRIIAYSCKDFTAEHASRLIKLKQCGHSDLLTVRDFFAEDAGAAELIEAAELIYAVLHKNLSGPYEFYELAFKRKFNILKQMSMLLAQEISAPVDESSAELVFLIRNKPQISRYTAALRNITADVWGCDISRTAVSRAHGVHVSKYIFRQPPVLAYEPPVSAELPEGTEAFCNDARRRRTIMEVFTRGGLGTAARSGAKWLILDLYDIICKMAEYHGSMFRTDDYLTKTELYRSIMDECNSCYLFEKRDVKFCFDMLSRFAKHMTEKYGKNIILIKTEPKKEYINSDGFTVPVETDNLYEIKRKFLGLCEERFIGITQCAVIDIARRFYAAEDNAPGSADTIRYEEEFYRLAGTYISDIMHGSEKRIYDRVNEEYMILRDMKINRE
ncbi:MAG: CapA family protein [Oscillospiraceae bacterium]|nr:CapA family protein [Oscillospiraceae bacterium]